jgi:hypothetical protein
MSEDEILLTDDDLELRTGRAKSCWQKDRLRGDGIPFIRVGRLIRYRKQDYEDWLRSRTCLSTSEYEKSDG